MRTFYLCILLALCVPVRLLAQVTDPTRATLDNLFAPLDKSQVPTGFLAEYATPLVPLDIFNGTLTDSSRTSPDGFRYLYATIYSARVYGSNPLPTIQDLNARTATAETNNGTTIPLLAQKIDYATVRPDAFNTNLLSFQNNQISDVAGRTQSPYLQRTLFAVAPTRTSSATGYVAFKLSYDLYTQNGGPPALNSGAVIDFNDGRGYVPLNWNQPVSTTYATSGTKRVKIRIPYYDGTSYESWFDFNVTNVDNDADSYAPSATNRPLQVNAFDGRVDPISGVRAGGTAYVQLANGHTQLTKPLIVAEGFDPSHVAPLLQDNLDLRYFISSISTGGNFNYYSSLYYNGYDIVYIDYDNGTDDILLNAALFEEVVKRVNASKTGTEDNTVMGISMGGLVARYGLADMEKAQPGSTQTRLLILQDSPQRGANVPLGVQALVRQSDINFGLFKLSDVNQTLKQALTLLDQPASQQLLLYRATDASNGFAANTFLENTYRNKVTFPNGQSPYLIIAASQGSQCGTPLFTPYTELIRGDGKFFVSPLPWISRYTYYAQVIANALPDGGQSNRVSTLQLYTILRLFGFINIRNNFVRQDYSCPSGLLAVDGVAGGTQYIGARVPTGTLPPPASYSFGPFFQLSYNYNLVREFCFIPTASALDLTDFNQTSFAGKFINGIASTSSSRANAFIAQEAFQAGYSNYYNLFHTTFTARNSEWMFDFMQDDPSGADQIACSTECNPVTSITGPSQVCTSPTSVFSIDAAGMTQVEWTASPSSYFTTSSHLGSQFTTTAASGAQGHGTITATFACGQSLTKDVSVGSAYPTGQYRYNGSYYQLTGTAFVGYNNYITMYLDQTYNFTFTSSDPNVPLIISGNTASFSLPYSVHQVTVTATAAGTGSDCGVSGGFIFVGTGYAYAVTPNPASSELTVSDDTSSADSPEAAKSTKAQAAGTDAATDKSFIVELFDDYGSKVKTKQSERGKAVLDVRDVPDGLYNVRVSQDSKTYSKHIQITH